MNDTDTCAEALDALAAWDNYEDDSAHLIADALRKMVERPAPIPSRDDIARSIALVDGLVSPPLSGKYGRYADAVIDTLRAERPAPTLSYEMIEAAVQAQVYPSTPNSPATHGAKRLAQGIHRALLAEHPAPTPDERADRLAIIVREALDEGGTNDAPAARMRTVLAQAEAEGLL